jgi:hypothetical protein
MDTDTARIIVLAVASILAIAWLFALQAMVTAARARSFRVREAAGRFDIDERFATGTYVGEVDVDGTPRGLSKKLAAMLARGPLGPVKILACDAQEVAFESGAPSPGIPIRGGRFRLSPSGRRTRIEYAVDGSSGAGLLAGGWIFLTLGLVALVAGVWLQFRFVLPSPNPQLRGQAVQMFQAVHFIWPPFLFAYLSRRTDRVVRAGIESLVNNLPYAE